MKKMLMVLLAVCLMLCAGSAMAEEVIYIERSWNPIDMVVNESPQPLKEYYTELTGKLDSLQTWGNTWYVVKEEDVEIKGIELFSSGGHRTYNLVLCDGASLTVQDGITLLGNSTLFIYGQQEGSGTLNAVIKSSGERNYVEIYGGTVNATRSGSDAAISGEAVGIYGGTVHATNNGSSEAINGKVYI